MMKLFSRATALLTVLSVAQAGGVVIFEGPIGGAGNLRVYDELTGALLSAPAALQGVTFVAFDHTGHTRLTERVGDLPRWRDDVPGAARLALPYDGGCLYHYRRTLAQGGTVYGYAHVTRDGDARPLLEVAGIGAGGLSDPFLGRVAVSPSADAFLAATAAEAGGNLLEVALGATPAVIDRTSDQAPRRFGGDSLALGESFGVAVCARGILRFDRAGIAPAKPVTFNAGQAPSYFSGQLVLSGNAHWAATTAGSGPSALHVFCFDATGIARRATTTPTSLSGGGFLPQVEDGPHLAVSDDGSQCAWRTEGATTEGFMRRVQSPPVVGPQFLTSDLNFLDTLDEVGVLYFHASGALSMAVGERMTPAGNAIEKMDFYDVTLSGGDVPSFKNMSMSSGDATLPFFSIPAIDPEDGMYLTPDRAAVVMHDDANGAVIVHRIGQVGVTPILTDVKELDLVEFAGAFALISIRRDSGQQRYELYRVPLTFATPPVLVTSIASGGRFERPSIRRESWIAFVTHELVGDRIGRVQLSTGTVHQFSPVPDVLGPTVGRTQLGSFVFSRGAPNAQHLVWPLLGGAPVQLLAPAGPGFVVPGA
ncbi:MAG: hypothetical protein ACKVWV_01240 [Planctomycetota bacterium]